MIRELVGPCPERRVPMLSRLLGVLDQSRDPELYAYVYISVHIADPNDDDILYWEGGPNVSEGPALIPDDPIVVFACDLRVLIKYSWEMIGCQ